MTHLFHSTAQTTRQIFLKKTERYRREVSQKDRPRDSFNSVIDWVSSVFQDVESEMRGLNWGAFYEKYHANAYDPNKVHSKLQELYSDYYVKNRKGVYEYILGGCVDTKLLEVRIFDDITKKRFIISRPPKQPQAAFPTVHFVRWVTITTSTTFIKLRKWTLTT